LKNEKWGLYVKDPEDQDAPKMADGPMCRACGEDWEHTSLLLFLFDMEIVLFLSSASQACLSYLPVHDYF
jgi:hypothetical protein